VSLLDVDVEKIYRNSRSTVDTVEKGEKEALVRKEDVEKKLKRRDWNPQARKGLP